MNSRLYSVSLIAMMTLVLMLTACAGAGAPAGEDAAQAPQQSQQETTASDAADAEPAEAPAVEEEEEMAAEEEAMPQMDDASAARSEEDAAAGDTLGDAAEMEEMDETMAEGEAMDDQDLTTAPPAPAAEAPALTANDGAVAPAPEPLPATPGEPLPTAAPSPGTAEQSAPDVGIVPPPTPPDVEVNPFTLTSEDNLSTFAMDVDTASYSAARNYLMSGTLPPAGTMRVEEFVNYFRYGYPNPQDGAFNIVVDGAPSPFSPDTQFVRVGIQGRRVDTSQRPDAMLTFVIDISGSMDEPERLPLVKEALTLLVDQLRESDRVAIVVYSDDTRVVLDHTSAAQRDTIVNAIQSLQIEGSTNVEAGLTLAYKVASDNYQNGSINRVILCSDGVANVGATGPEAIRANIRDYASQGVVLTTVGFGMGTFNDYLMEQLANDGNGNYAYVDTLKEAERVFVQNLTSTLQVIAQDAKIQVDFNPEVVSQYRLLGYENRAVADEDFRNDEVDAGEVGAGHSVTALYEVRLTGQASGTALTAQVRYEDPESGEVVELQTPFDSSAIAAEFTQAPPNFQLAVAVAGFAENLRRTGYAQDRPLGQVLEIAERVEPQFANDGDVQEFVELVRRAQSISR